MAEDLRIFGTDFDTVNALRVTTQEGPQILYTLGDNSGLRLQNKSVTPAEIAQTILPDETYYGLSQVNVDPIPSAYLVPEGTLTINRNGTFNVKEYANAEVAYVPNNQNKSISPTLQQQTLSADSGYDGLGTITIEAIRLQNKTVSPTTAKQTISADSGYNGLGTVTINAPSLQDKTITPTKSTQTVNYDSNYIGLNQVTINPIPDNYIDTTDSTATKDEIFYGKTAYVNTEKITGTYVACKIYEGATEPSDNMGNIGDMYIQVG